MDVILNSLASHDEAVPFADSVTGPVAMHECGYTAGNVCKR